MVELADIPNCRMALRVAAFAMHPRAKDAAVSQAIRAAAMVIIIVQTPIATRPVDGECSSSANVAPADQLI